MDDCNYIFTKPRHLQDHLKRHENWKHDLQKVLCCPEADCPKGSFKFHVKSRLATHIRLVHLRITAYRDPEENDRSFEIRSRLDELRKLCNTTAWKQVGIEYNTTVAPSASTVIPPAPTSKALSVRAAQDSLRLEERDDTSTFRLWIQGCLRKNLMVYAEYPSARNYFYRNDRSYEEM